MEMTDNIRCNHRHTHMKMSRGATCSMLLFCSRTQLVFSFILNNTSTANTTRRAKSVRQPFGAFEKKRKQWTQGIQIQRVARGESGLCR